MFKKIGATLSMGILAMTMMSFGALSANAFTDVDDSEMYMKGIDFLYSQGIVNGNPDGSYAPKKVLNRAEMLKIISEGAIKLNGGEGNVFDPYLNQKCFNDVPTDAWFTKYVCYAKDKGWVKGYEGNKFKPEQDVTFAEGLKMTAKAFGLAYDEASEPWYKDLVEVASGGNYIPQSITGFNNGFKRNEMADMVTRIIKKNEGEDSFKEYLGDWAEVTVSYETIEKGENLSGEEEEEVEEEENDVENDSEETNDNEEDMDNTEEEADLDTDTEDKITVDASGFSSDANYKGPFPAPEGVVLLGKYGEDKYKDPTGDGFYRYHTQIAWQRDVQCLDSSRTIDKSQGKTWEKGFWAGFNTAAAEAKEIDPEYDNTPWGTGSGTTLYDDGYVGGYNYSWDGGTEPRFGCPPKDGSTDLTKYDDDGWYKHTEIDEATGIKELYTPPMISLGASSQSILGADSTSLGLDNFLDALKDSEFNEKKDPVNIYRIDILESEAEKGIDLEKDLMDFYNETKDATYVKYKNTVAFISGDTPTIDTKTYGKNTFSTLTYVTATDAKWYVAYYAQRQDPKTGKVITMYFYDPLDISNSTKDDFDLTKTPKSEFVEQLLGKIVFANY